jgi:hypothetical protein
MAIIIILWHCVSCLFVQIVYFHIYWDFSIYFLRLPTEKRCENRQNNQKIHCEKKNTVFSFSFEFWLSAAIYCESPFIWTRRINSQSTHGKGYQNLTTTYTARPKPVCERFDLTIINSFSTRRRKSMEVAINVITKSSHQSQAH